MKTRFASLLFLSLMVATSAKATVLATDPADYVPLPPGTNLGLLYYQQSESTAFYADGRRTPAPFDVQSDIGVVRYIHYASLFGFTVTPQVIMPFGSVRMSAPANLHSNGTGDPFIGSAIWFINDPDHQRYLSTAQFVSAPLGTYHTDQGSLNLGAHRWTAVTHLNYSQNITGPVFLDLTGEVAFYGTNNDFAGADYKQRPTFSLQSHLRYELSNRTRIAITYYHTAGGRTELNGVTQSASMSTDTCLFTVAHFLTPSLQLEIQGGQDVHVRNGPKDKLRLNLRLAKAF